MIFGNLSVVDYQIDCPNTFSRSVNFAGTLIVSQLITQATQSGEVIGSSITGNNSSQWFLRNRSLQPLQTFICQNNQVSNVQNWMVSVWMDASPKHVSYICEVCAMRSWWCMQTSKEFQSQSASSSDANAMYHRRRMNYISNSSGNSAGIM